MINTDMSLLHLYPQQGEHMAAYIIGNSIALQELRGPLTRPYRRNPLSWRLSPPTVKAMKPTFC